MRVDMRVDRRAFTFVTFHIGRNALDLVLSEDLGIMTRFCCTVFDTRAVLPSQTMDTQQNAVCCHTNISIHISRYLRIPEMSRAMLQNFSRKSAFSSLPQSARVVPTQRRDASILHCKEGERRIFFCNLNRILRQFRRRARREKVALLQTRSQFRGRGG